MTSKPKKTVYLYDEGNYPVFRISIEDSGEYKGISFKADVYGIQSWEADGTKKPCEDDIELYLSCHIKWDSCSHFYFGEKDEEGNQDGYLHICGAESYKQHVDLMNYLYHLAFREMEIEPYDEREIWDLDMKVLHQGANNV